MATPATAAVFKNVRRGTRLLCSVILPAFPCAVDQGSTKASSRPPRIAAVISTHKVSRWRKPFKGAAQDRPLRMDSLTQKPAGTASPEPGQTAIIERDKQQRR